MHHLTKTKLTNNRYPKTVLGYQVILSKATSPQQGGVALLWEEGHQDFEVEAVNIVSSNLLTFQLVTWEDKYFVMGAYIPPTNATGVDDLRATWAACPTNCNRCCWGISTLISEPRKLSRRRSLQISLTTSMSSTRHTSTSSAKGNDRGWGRNGPGGSGGTMSWPGKVI